ncbi:MAG TPA: type VI secretion system ATPase TssH [Thermoanaerobaculia bacterium]|nr:type VI secretion system ATPase TssH [Thermoanaerobaculia bacterium]
MSVELKSLIDKLSPLCRRTLEEAAGLCVSRSHYNVEIEHLLAKLLALPDGQDTDLRRAMREYGLDRTLLSSQIEAALGRFDTGNSRTPAFSPQILQLFREAWVASSLQLRSPAVRTGSLLLALLDHDLLRGVALQSVPELGKIPRDKLREDARELFRGSAEDVGSGAAPSSSQSSLASGASASAASEGSGEAGMDLSPTPALDQYTLDLTARARAGEIDPIRGRDSEIRQVIDILSRRRQNNPILVGEAGVGKTAVVEGLALRIAEGDVPPSHRNLSLRLLDLGLLQAGAGVKGEFENRLKSVIDEVKGSPKPIILFIDEAHTMIGAGGAAGQNDAANLLKPALARGELRTIAATTWAEYKKYFEKDPALARRFQVVKVGEPAEDAAVDMLRGLATHLEEHHKVRVLDEAIRDAVSLSHRYIMGRQLPDKAISVLDTACARVALGLNGTPQPVENAAREIERLELEMAILKRERAAGQPPTRRMGPRVGSPEEMGTELARLKTKHAELEERWKRELDLAKQILDLQAEVDEKGKEDKPDPAEAARLAGRIGKLREELRKLQGEDPMVHVWVDSRVVAAVISAWTGIPAGKMMTDEIHALLSLRERMAERVVGQSHALDAIARRINTSRAQLDDPGKPIGVFLLVGPSGVGKTETAVTLADVLYGGARNMVTVNMSEFQEAHSVSTLKGAPPGYVGYGSGGVLTEAVRRNPYSVVLLDEMEKAHPDVAEIFYQVFDKGTLEDGEGVTVDFKNTVILLTSNVGSEVIARLTRETGKDGHDRLTPERLVEEVRPALLKHFRPAFLGRVVVVPYYPLGEREVREIVELKLARIRERIRAGHHAELTYGEELVEAIAGRCTEVESGARNVDHILTQTLLPELSGSILEKMAAGESIARVHVGLDDSGGFAYKVR